MTLENLLKTGQLSEYSARADEVQRLLEAARRNIADAKVAAISLETRFDAAYKAIMQMAMTALLVNNFRPSTSAPGHHMTMIQALPKTIGLPKTRMVVLDALRRKRNVADYLGGYVDQTALDSCIDEAELLLNDVEVWIAEHRKELLSS
ncbi:MAG: HEPN domain-containing protein [Desulfuromonadaceae bacterium]|nr:HEPN domain-containing protein [Desulfuromonadaceae bacterium]